MKEVQLQGYRKNFIKLLSAFMVFYPWITYLQVSQYSEAEKALFGGYNGLSIDFFIHHKEIILILMACVALFWVIGERVLPRKIDKNIPLIKGKNKGLFVLIGVFFVGVLISTIFSEYTDSAIWGLSTEGEGVWTLFAYIVLIMAFYNSFASGYGMSMLKCVMTALSGITVVFTLVEWFYKPLLEIGVVQAFVAPAKYAEIVASMKAQTFSSAISLTFHNPGYFGGFVCILIPFTLLYGLQAKKTVEKVVHGILFAGLLFAIVASNTTTALYIAILEILLIVIANVISGVKKTKIVFVIVCMVLTLVLSGIVTGNSFVNIFSNANSATGNVEEERFAIKDIQMKKNKLVLIGGSDSIEMTYSDRNLTFKNNLGEIIPHTYKDGYYNFKESEYKNLAIGFMKTPDEMQEVDFYILVDAGYQDTIDFFVLKNGTFSGVGQNGMVLRDIGDAGTPDVLKSFYGLFTGRGYAWVNSLPILKETLLIGKGPGNFPYYFKQFDYMGMLTTHETVKKIIDKPHSAYLQYAINLGLPAAIGFFGVFVLAVYKAVCVFLKKRDFAVKENSFHLAATVSVIGFLLYSVVNDSIVTVTPMVCMVTGALLASCYMSEHK